LPIHAAGLYSGNNLVSISDYAVSSYTPSLSALIKARETSEAIPKNSLRALIVAEANAPGLPVLASVEEEVRIIAEIMDTDAFIINDIDESPTIHSVLKGLPETHILHLSCHGQQHAEDPLSSCFALRDGELTISTLMGLNLPNANLAFLGACETAKANEEQPDQAVHLAASMLFCGFRSVVATMW
jgi:CHAT domain-containing protein